MPRVGSSSIRIRACAISQRPITAFCWLPPDRVAIGVAGLAVLTRIVSMIARAPLASARVRSHGDAPRRLRQPIAIFSCTAASGMIPASLRSSGHSPSPAAIAARGSPAASGLSRTVTAPPARGAAPYSSRNSSDRPAPTSPKKPSISPSATSNDTGWRSPAPVTPSARSAAAPAGRGR